MNDNQTLLLNYIPYALIIITLLCIIYYLNHLYYLHKSENLSKDRLLKIMNKIGRIKLSALNIDELINLICQHLEENLEGKFQIILTENINNLNLDKSYLKIIKNVLSKKLPFVLSKNNKITYFYPLYTPYRRKLGILIAEIDCNKNLRNKVSDFIKNWKASCTYFEKFLSLLSRQISGVMDNFTTRISLNEAKINEEKEKLRCLMLSSISHDLRTPLSSIIMGLSTLKKFDQLSERNRKTLINSALKESERLNKFIADVLKMTRLESGAVRVNKKFLSPSLIIEKIIKIFKEKLKGYQLEISLNNQIEINFDKISLEQIMQNLIENTIKYSFKNTKITICDQLSSDSYCIFIKDEGMGIDKTKLDLIFNKFERLDSKNKASGTGLGLSITKALMELNNSTIRAQNGEDGKGAVFILEFKDFKIVSN